MKFGSWIVFVAPVDDAVYFPVAHWVFGTDELRRTPLGWLGKQAMASTSPVEPPSTSTPAAAGLAFALVLGKRVGWRKEPMRPHNLPFVLLGAGLLWFGWFGFNAGSALAPERARRRRRS